MQTHKRCKGKQIKLHLWKANVHVTDKDRILWSDVLNYSVIHLQVLQSDAHLSSIISPNPSDSGTSLSTWQGPFSRTSGTSYVSLPKLPQHLVQLLICIMLWILNSACKLEQSVLCIEKTVLFVVVKDGWWVRFMFLFNSKGNSACVFINWGVNVCRDHDVIPLRCFRNERYAMESEICTQFYLRKYFYKPIFTLCILYHCNYRLGFWIWSQLT